MSSVVVCKHKEYLDYFGVVKSAPGKVTIFCRETGVSLEFDESSLDELVNKLCDMLYK